MNLSVASSFRTSAYQLARRWIKYISFHGPSGACQVTTLSKARLGIRSTYRKFFLRMSASRKAQA